MSCNRSLGTLGAVLLVMVVILAVPTTWAQTKYKTLYKFTGGADGNVPYAGLIFDAAGNLYGAARSGGANNGGAVFELTPTQNGRWTESVLYSFCSLANCSDGDLPNAGLIFDQAGNLYGTTFNGGAVDSGTVFELTPKSDGSWTESVLHSFCALAGCGDGSNPSADLIFDGAGNLYGTAGAGGPKGVGVVFELTNGGSTFRVIHGFTGHQDGGYPESHLIFDSAGNLYGTTFGGGKTRGGCGFSGGCGVVLKLKPNTDGSWTESVLYSFIFERGGYSEAGLIFDQVGNLYGTTFYGGPLDGGAVFELTPNSDGSWKQKVLHNFNRFQQGVEPNAGVIFDQAGDLYGTVRFGGSNGCAYGSGCGVVFKLVQNPKGGWSETVLHLFFDHPGADPVAGVILDAAGNLYGTTVGDGTATFGSVFEITP